MALCLTPLITYQQVTNSSCGLGFYAVSLALPVIEGIPPLSSAGDSWSLAFAGEKTFKLRTAPARQRGGSNQGETHAMQTQECKYLADHNSTLWLCRSYRASLALSRNLSALRICLKSFGPSGLRKTRIGLCDWRPTAKPRRPKW